jgi:hypothetical protein
LMISQVCFIAFYTFLIIICIGLENAATLGWHWTCDAPY